MRATDERISETSPQIATPYFDDVGVLALVPETWAGEMWYSRHQVLSRLSRYFNVVWFDPPLEWRELWFGNKRPNENGGHRKPPEHGFAVYSQSRWLPKMFKPDWLARLTNNKRLQVARQRLIQMGARKIIVYVWRPGFAEVLDLVDHDVSCYHIADEYSFSTTETPIPAEERQLIGRVDQVFIHSRALLAKKGALNPRTLHVTNGVDYRSFATPVPEPEEMRNIPHPRIGYVGRIKVQLDWELIRDLAASHPGWSFVFVGPLGNMRERRPFIDALFEMPNVHYLGPKTIDETPGYIQHLDVCALWYLLDDYTKYIYPLKLHEYLASGRPVVGTPIHALREFESVVATARSREEWAGAISNALSEHANSGGQVDLRRGVAREHDWDHLVGLIGETLCEHLGPTYVRKMGEIRILNSSRHMS